MSQPPPYSGQGPNSFLRQGDAVDRAPFEAAQRLHGHSQRSTGWRRVMRRYAFVVGVLGAITTVVQFSMAHGLQAVVVGLVTLAAWGLVLRLGHTIRAISGEQQQRW